MLTRGYAWGLGRDDGGRGGGGGGGLVKSMNKQVPKRRATSCGSQAPDARGIPETIQNIFVFKILRMPSEGVHKHQTAH